MSISLDSKQEKISLKPPELLPYAVAECQQLGRYLVAAKDLRKGEIILQEYPLAAAPQKGSILICPGCFKTPTIQCPECGWPICEIYCPEISRHKEAECRILSLATKPENNAAKAETRIYRNWNSLQETAMAIRCLSLKSNKDKWQDLMNMETNWEQWSRSSLYENAKDLVKVIREEYGISDHVYSTEEIMKVLAILDINAYEVKMPDVNIQGAYKLASLAEHSCIPNALKTTSSETLLLTLRAATNIPKGAHIATTYCDVLWPTCQRQKYIQWSKFFVCQCKRCLDPTELGSNISSLLCPKCSFGTPLMPNLDKEQGDNLWSNMSKDYYCLRCDTKLEADVCENMVIKAETQLQELDKDCSPESITNFEEWLHRWTVSPAAKSFSDGNTLDKATNKGVPYGGYLDKISSQLLYLHPQHAVCLDACHTVFLLYSTNNSTTEELRRKESLGTHLLQATSSLFSDIAMFRGTIMYELALTKAALFAHCLDEEDSGDGPDLRTLAKEILWLLSEALDILKYESEDQPEGQLFRLAFKQMEEIQPFLKEILPDL